MSPLLVLAIAVHEVATTLCYPSYSSFERITVSLCESDCLHEVVPFVADVASSSGSGLGWVRVGVGVRVS